MTTLERPRPARLAFPAIAKTQFLIARRTPALLAATVALPVLLYLVLGTSNRNATVHGIPWTAYSLAGLGAYSAGSIMVFNSATWPARTRPARRRRSATCCSRSARACSSR